MTNFFCYLKKLLQISALLFCLLSLMILVLLFGSYPSTSGKKRLSTLESPARIERDSHGIPTVFAKNRLDVARTVGFLHAQERFFQMDLLRRMSAGELSELIGPATVELDKSKRLHSPRNHVRSIVANLSSYERKILTAYTEGVNAGLNALYIRPFEYLLLREKPRPWTEEDSILVGLELFFDLQDSNAQLNRLHQIMKRCLPEKVTQFMAYNGSIWSAPLDKNSPPILPIPPKESFSRLTPRLVGLTEVEYKTKGCPGSNQWAVAPSCTKDKRAIVACDMHLTLRVPSIWYRLSFEYPSPQGSTVRLDGISLPGVPFLVAGSNRHIAWGFTNGCIETSRLVTIETDPLDQNYYLTAEGKKPFEVQVEEIKVKGAPSLYQTTRWTKWGPVHPDLLFGKLAAICWAGDDPDCLNMRIFDLETIHSTEEALKALPFIHLPVFNFIAADDHGHIGWGLVGGTPQEVSPQGEDSSITTDWVHENSPPLLDPIEGRLWTANNRVVINPMLGNAYHNPARAHQIKKRLFATNEHTMASMYSMQLDEEASFFDRWEKVLEENLDKTNDQHAKILTSIQQWDHHCSASSQGFFWIRTFREMVIKNICTRIFSPCLDASPQFRLGQLDFDEPIYLIVTQQPSYLVDPVTKSWRAELTSIIDTIIRENPEPLNGDGSWGLHNVSAVCHPLTKAIPALSFFLDMPKMPIGGDYYVPKATGPAFGASMRMVVSPGHEEDGIMNMPCGQSGHPLSPQYRDQHKAWLEGTPTPFLPGETKYTLELAP